MQRLANYNRYYYYNKLINLLKPKLDYNLISLLQVINNINNIQEIKTLYSNSLAYLYILYNNSDILVNNFNKKDIP